MKKIPKTSSAFLALTLGLSTGLLGACERLVLPELPPESRVPVTDQAPAPVFGSFESQSCFLNKGASEGFGSAVYTHAIITLNEGGTGGIRFELYSDANCASELMSGDSVIEFSTKVVGSLLLVDITQHVPGESESQRFFLPVFVDGDGNYRIDIDYTDGQSGPYESEPSNLELGAFATNPEGLGVLFRRI